MVRPFTATLWQVQELPTEAVPQLSTVMLSCFRYLPTRVTIWPFSERDIGFEDDPSLGSENTEQFSSNCSLLGDHGLVDDDELSRCLPSEPRAQAAANDRCSARCPGEDRDERTTFEDLLPDTDWLEVDGARFRVGMPPHTCRATFDRRPGSSRTRSCLELRAAYVPRPYSGWSRICWTQACHLKQQLDVPPDVGR
jgi:hypothetical protein